MKLSQNAAFPEAPGLSRTSVKRPSDAKRFVTRLPFSSVAVKLMMRLLVSTVLDTSTESTSTWSCR